MTDIKHYAYRVLWSAEDGEFVATVAEFPSLSWLHADQAQALQGLVDLVADIVADLEAHGDPIHQSPRRFWKSTPSPYTVNWDLCRTRGVSVNHSSDSAPT